MFVMGNQGRNLVFKVKAWRGQNFSSICCTSELAVLNMYSIWLLLLVTFILCKFYATLTLCITLNYAIHYSNYTMLVACSKWGMGPGMTPTFRSQVMCVYLWIRIPSREVLTQWRNFVADSFHTKKLCSRLSSSQVRF